MKANKMNRQLAAGVRQTASAGRLRWLRMDEASERDRVLSDPESLNQLEPAQRAALVDWIGSVLVPAKTVFRRNSYGMKHDFEKEPDGFYVWNGAFKGAMLAAGHRPVDADELNWRFRVKPAHPLSRSEQRKYRRYGRGRLVRDRWREVGYIVLESAQRGRILEHGRLCEREERPEVVVLQARYTAKVILRTASAGCRLTQESVAAVLALFADFDPNGRHSYVDELWAEIERVPVHRAGQLAAELVRITQSCSTKTIPGHGTSVGG